MKPKNYPIIGLVKTESNILDGKMKILTADLSPEYLTAFKISYSSEKIENKEKSE